MRVILGFVGAAGGLALPQLAYALDVSPSTDGIEIDRDLTLWQDPSRNADIEQAAQQLQQGHFRAPQGMARSRGYSRDAWWFRFELRNSSAASLPVRVEYTDGLIGRVTLYSRPAGSQLACASRILPAAKPKQAARCPPSAPPFLTPCRRKRKTNI